MSWLENLVVRLVNRVDSQIDDLTISKEFIAATDAYTAGNFKEALALYEDLAAKNHPRSTALAGKMYLLGEGAKENGAKAIKYLEAAMAAGDKDAITLLGMAYAAGKAGVKVDYIKARPLLELAVKNGDAAAQRMLDIMASKQMGKRRR